MRGPRRITTRVKEGIQFFCGQSDAEEQWSTGYTQHEDESEKDWRRRVTGFQEWVVHERDLSEEAAQEVEARLIEKWITAGYACASYGKQTTRGDGLYSVFSVKHSGMIYHDMGITYVAMSQLWMKIALQQYERAEAIERQEGETVVTYELFRRQVGTVCGGLAFELLWKALVQLDEKIAPPSHLPGQIMGNARREMKEDVETVAKSVGWKDLDELHEFLDFHLCNPDVKYNLRTPDGRGGRGFTTWGVGKRSIPELGKLHAIVTGIWNAEFARRRRK